MDTTENKVKHTPGPFECGGPPYTKNQYGVSEIPIHGSGGMENIATVYDGFDMGFQNAEFIVRACNSHYDLIKALQKMMGYIDDGTLVRNTENDANADWHIKMIRFVQDLKFMQETLKKATS